MFGLENVSGFARAVAIVGAVLAEAIGLYVGYGVLSNAVGVTVIDALRGD